MELSIMNVFIRYNKCPTKIVSNLAKLDKRRKLTRHSQTIYKMNDDNVIATKHQLHNAFEFSEGDFFI